VTTAFWRNLAILSYEFVSPTVLQLFLSTDFRIFLHKPSFPLPTLQVLLPRPKVVEIFVFISSPTWLFQSDFQKEDGVDREHKI
jgi:hypothetical protein